MARLTAESTAEKLKALEENKAPIELHKVF